MQHHPALILPLIVERERRLRRRAERARSQARGDRPVRTAPWPP
jgi:hypothetical protein